LDNDDFSELVKMVSAAFIEAEVAVRVERILEEKVEKVLESKISTDYLLGLWK